ncbi:hypothetical protein DW690_21250 [Dorea longicatena]|nr:hypothetical protein DW690_21250 [Dorea longicatena]
MQGIFQKENTDKALKYGIYRHLPTYEKIIRNLVSFYRKIYSFYVHSCLIDLPKLSSGRTQQPVPVTMPGKS